MGMDTRSCGLVCAFLAILAGVSRPAVGQCDGDTAGATCVCDTPGSSITICFDIIGAPEDPVETTDFDVDFTDGDFPDIELKKESQNWRLWSYDANNPNNIGDLGVITSPHPKNFWVELKTPAGLAGARNCKGIDLILTLASKSSKLTGGSITSNLGDSGTTTALRLQLSSTDVGGSADFTIPGNVNGDLDTGDGANLTINGSINGDITIEHGAGFVIANDYGFAVGTRFITIGDITGGDLDIQGDVDNVDVSVDVISTGQLDLEGDALSPTTITIDDLQASGVLRIGSGAAAGSAVSFAAIEIHSNVPSTATIDLRNAVQHGDVVLGNPIPDSDLGGTFWAYDMNGDLSMSGLTGSVFIGHDATGLILALGSLTGGIDIAGDLAGNVTLGSGAAGTITVGGNVSSTITVGGVLSGRIAVDGNLSGNVTTTSGVTGTIKVGGDVSSDITIGGSLTNNVVIGGTLSGDLTIDGQATGDVVIGGNLSGTVDVSQEVEGDIHISGDASGDIAMEELQSVGRVLVDGSLSGNVTIDEQTGTSTLILVGEGITSTGSITINADEELWDANGPIQIGADRPPASVTFDGCIAILDDFVTGDCGDLTARLLVAGCHATADDLGICIDGNDNGKVDISQTGCANQVGYSCNDCPAPG